MKAVYSIRDARLSIDAEIIQPEFPHRHFFLIGYGFRADSK
jgi:hypothetical protein